MDAPLPAPPLPPDVDLTNFPFMPLDVARLRRSKAWLICKRRPELAFYMINLWTASWHETPAGSLEDDDDVLADLAMCPPREWPKLKVDVLRGWMKYSDGRLYHETVVEKASEAWKAKLVDAHKRECDRLRKENKKRAEDGRIALRFPDFEDWKAARDAQSSGGTVAPSAGIPTESALKGQGQGELKGQGERSSLREDLRARVESDRIGMAKIREIYPGGIYPQSKWLLGEREARNRVDEGETWEVLIAGSAGYAAQCASIEREAKYVYSPENFFGTKRLYRDDFPIPQTREQMQHDRALKTITDWAGEPELANAAN